jgi:hypothetical protein
MDFSIELQASEPSLNYQSDKILTCRVRTLGIPSGKFLCGSWTKFPVILQIRSVTTVDSTEDFNRSTEAVFYLICGVCLQLAALGNTSRQM